MNDLHISRKMTAPYKHEHSAALLLAAMWTAELNGGKCNAVSIYEHGFREKYVRIY
jgi:hypothetical protein